MNLTIISRRQRRPLRARGRASGHRRDGRRGHCGRDFYRQLFLALGLAPAATAAAVFYAVTTYVENLAKDRVHPVFLLDEAHLLHQDLLDHLHVLLNYEWDSRALLSIILIGLPDLKDRLELRKNRSLYSRIHRRLTIEPMSSDDITEYLRMRLARAPARRRYPSARARGAARPGDAHPSVRGARTQARWPSQPVSASTLAVDAYRAA